MTFDFTNTPTFIVILIFLFGVYKIKKLNDWERLVLLILLLNIIVDLISIRLTTLGRETTVCYNISIPIELIMVFIVYYLYLQPRIAKKILLFVIPALGLFSIINSVYFQNFNTEFNSHTFFVGGFLISLFSYLIWRFEVRENDIHPNNLILWFAAANFLYYIVTIPAVIANNWLIDHDKAIALPVHLINVVMYGVSSIIIGLGLIWKRKQIV